MFISSRSHCLLEKGGRAGEDPGQLRATARLLRLLAWGRQPQTGMGLHVLRACGLCRLQMAVIGETELISLLSLRGVLGDVAAATETSRDWA